MRFAALLAILLAVTLEAAAQNPLARGTRAFPVPHIGIGISRPLAEITLSGASPLAANCGLGGGVLYRGAEVEPWLVVDPHDARHWIAVWQQDRWSNGSSRGLVTAVTFDAGATWARATPRFSACEGGHYDRVSDPWVDIAPDGTAWQIGLASTGSSFTANSVNAILVTRSMDGGLTWSDPVELIRDVGAAFFNDKETITADPFDGRFAYAVWDRLRGNDGGPTYFSRTTDRGLTWEPARAIHDPGAGEQTIGNLIRVLPDGTLVNLFTHIRGGAEDEDKAEDQASLEVLRSTDRGATWSGPFRISSFGFADGMDPFTRVPIRDGSPIAAMAAGPDGSLNVAWQDARISPDPERNDILLARSLDGGRTWSTPVRVNGAPGKSAFAPQVNVAADGTIGVTYFDLRSETIAAQTLLADYWLAHSRDGVNWTEVHVAGPFDLQTAPFAGGYFLGDYMGLASASGAFLALHVCTTGDPANPTDVILARVPTDAPGLTYPAQEAP
jgi:BNR/Asp-box repeat.